MIGNAVATNAVFLVLVLPAIALDILCTLAVLYARPLKWKIRVVTVNIFIAEVGTWIAYCGHYLGFTGRALNSEESFSCSVAYSAAILSSCARFTSIALYAVSVYVYVKYGVKKLKWVFVIVYLVVSWTVCVTIGMLALFPQYGAFNDKGFCVFDSNSWFFRLSLYLFFVLIGVCLCVIVIFSILTFRFIKKNALEESRDIKKAIANNLLYLFVASVFLLVSNLFPASFSAIRKDLEQSGNGIIGLILVNYVLRLVVSYPFSIATPIATIVIIKPTHVALKTLLRKCCKCSASSIEAQD